MDVLIVMAAAGALFSILLSYALPLRTNRFALPWAALPLAAVPVCLASFAATSNLIRGFRGMAVAGSGGIGNFGEALLRTSCLSESLRFFSSASTTTIGRPWAVATSTGRRRRETTCAS